MRKLALGLVAATLALPGTASAVIHTCTPNATTLCVGDGQFAITATWRIPDGTTGQGQAVSITADTGYFWFFQSSNVEFVIKVLDGCPINGRFWVFAGGLTNVHVDIAVNDVVFGVTNHYINNLNTPFQPVQDTSAFHDCLISSQRFKQDIRDLGTPADELMKLRPVAYRYRPEYDDGQGLAQYGLIAEEVAGVDKNLVQYGTDGKPHAIRYHLVNALMLKEVQDQHRTIAAQEERLAGQAREIEALQKQLAEVLRTLGKPPSTAAEKP